MNQCSYTIDIMATRERKRPKPDYGQRLEARRLALHKKSLDDIVKETNGRIYKQLWYRVENGLKKPKSLTPDQISDFALVLEWTPQQVAEALGIRSLSLDVKNSTSAPDEGDVGVRFVNLRIVGNSELGTDYPVPEPFLEGHADSSCFIVPASGHVLACRRVMDDFEKANMFIFTNDAEPVEDSVVVYKMKDTGNYLICYFLEAPRRFPVESYDGKEGFYIEVGDPRLEFCGVGLNFLGTLQRSVSASRAN